MYQIQDLIKKTTPLPIHIIHQHKDQTAGVEQKKSKTKKKKRNMETIINRNLRDKKIAELAKDFLKHNEPIRCTV